jgi:Abi-like protein
LAKKQDVFPYTTEQLEALGKALSIERLQPYVILSDRDPLLAIKLYEWNTALSESFYGLLQGLEIALRNAMHRVLGEAYGREDWYDVCDLRPEQKDVIAKAKNRILSDKKLVTPPKVVAEMTFGFWVALSGPTYAQKLWDRTLHRAFVKKLGRKALHKRLDKIRKLRNRVAHHESILARELKDDFSSIVETVHWICPVTAAWIKANNTFHARYAQKPALQNSPVAEPAQGDGQTPKT